jgi:hypothetical protein
MLHSLLHRALHRKSRDLHSVLRALSKNTPASAQPPQPRHPRPKIRRAKGQ